MLQKKSLVCYYGGLLLEENSQQNIGKGKPYGYGRISVELKELQILDNEALYNGDSLCLQPYKPEKETEKYKKYNTDGKG